MVRPSKTLGFSLVELLIALVVLSSMTLLAGTSLSMFMQQWNGMKGTYQQEVRDLMNALAVFDTLEQVHPFIVNDLEGRPRFYFEGNRNGLVAFTNQSFQSPEYPAIIRLSVVQQDDFLYSLIYEEAGLSGTLFQRIDTPLDFRQPILLGTDYDEVLFEYLGEKPVIDRFDSNEAERQTSFVDWSTDYNSLALGYYPQQIKVYLAKKGIQESFVIELVQPSNGHRSRLSSGLESGGDDTERFGY